MLFTQLLEFNKYSSPFSYLEKIIPQFEIIEESQLNIICDKFLNKELGQKFFTSLNPTLSFITN